jgi:16S rRNA (cytosine1402-N4)-methyltransferase
VTGAAHVTVLLEDAVDALAIKADGVYVDATFGRGGHSCRILSVLNEKGRLVAVDRDPQAIAAGASIDDPRFLLVHRAFGELGAAAEAGVSDVDGILFDVGVSSPQIDDGERGSAFATMRRSTCAWIQRRAKRRPSGWRELR